MTDLSLTLANIRWISGSAPQGMVADETLTRGQPVYQDSDTLEFKLAGATLGNSVAGISLTDGFNDGQMIYAPDGAVIDIGATTVAATPYCVSRNTGKIAPYSDLQVGDACVFLFWGTGTSQVTLEISRGTKLKDAYLAYLQSLGFKVLFRLNESSGGVAANAGTLGSAADGSYSNVTLADTIFLDGNFAAKFNGSSSNVEIFSAALQGAFSFAEGSLLVWTKFTGNWADTNFYGAVQIGVDVNNRLLIYKNNSANIWSMYLAAGGAGAQRNVTTSLTTWMLSCLTYHKANNRIRGYHQGALQVADIAYTGTGAGSLTTAWTDVGGPSGLWFNGWETYVGWIDRELTAAENLEMYSRLEA